MRTHSITESSVFALAGETETKTFGGLIISRGFFRALTEGTIHSGRGSMTTACRRVADRHCAHPCSRSVSCVSSDGMRAVSRDPQPIPRSCSGIIYGVRPGGPGHWPMATTRPVDPGCHRGTGSIPVHSASPSAARDAQFPQSEIDSGLSNESQEKFQGNT